MSAGKVIFVVNLLQDINIHRPLVMLTAIELKIGTRFLVTSAFRKRDKTGLWQQELNDIANATQSPIHDFENEYQALQILQGGQGALVAASESHLEAHKPVHDLFRIAPSQYVKITLQHGFECVGFLQSRDQNLAHGSNITFAADIICGWCSLERLTSIAPSQRHKLRVTGPTALLLPPKKEWNASFPSPVDQGRIGLVCENMHSSRLNTVGDFKSEFLNIFTAFSTQLALEGHKIALRPHPGGQYVINNAVPLLDNVIIENDPIYKIDLSVFAYGISAPSSILIDMILAGIPVAVWQDKESVMDMGNYKGLARISSTEDWLNFAHDAMQRPEFYQEKQRIFLIEQKLQLKRDKIHHGFTSLINSLIKRNGGRLVSRHKSRRYMFFAPEYIPTLQLSFLKPLLNNCNHEDMVIDILTETELNQASSWSKDQSGFQVKWVKSRIQTFGPDVIVFCRWAGSYTSDIVDYINSLHIPIVYHLDDDLLNVPKEIGVSKYEYHNKPERLHAVRYLLNNVNIVYCSTLSLASRLSKFGHKSPILSGDIYCAGSVMKVPICGPVQKIGYMGIGHEADLQIVLPAIIRFLEKYKDISFELFGTIPRPKELDMFGNQVVNLPKTNNYNEFLGVLVGLDWDIGICPLQNNNFNIVKANTKWVEYTSASIAVVASKSPVYDECCADGCGLLVETTDEWFLALDGLVRDPAERYRQILRAQDKLQKNYSVDRLRDQVLDVFAQARALSHAANQN